MVRRGVKKMIYSPAWCLALTAALGLSLSQDALAREAV